MGMDTMRGSLLDWFLVWAEIMEKYMKDIETGRETMEILCRILERQKDYGKFV